MINNIILIFEKKKIISNKLNKLFRNSNKYQTPESLRFSRFLKTEGTEEYVDDDDAAERFNRQDLGSAVKKLEISFGIVQAETDIGI